MGTGLAANVAIGIEELRGEYEHKIMAFAIVRFILLCCNNTVVCYCMYVAIGAVQYR